MSGFTGLNAPINDKDGKQCLDLLTLSITDQCNLSCPYCHNQQERTGNVNMSLKDIKAVYDNFAPVRHIHIYGGEPLTRWDDIIELTDYIHKDIEKRKSQGYDAFGYEIAIKSNGTIPVDYTRMPTELRKNIMIHFSLDGFEETNSQSRGKGNFEKVVESIRLCEKAGIRVSIAATFTDEIFAERIDYVQNFVDFCESLPAVRSLALNFIIDAHTRKKQERFQTPLAQKARANAESIRHSKLHFLLTHDTPCKLNGINVRADGTVTLRCPFLKLETGNALTLERTDYIKILKYANSIGFDCNTSNFERMERYIQAMRSNRIRDVDKNGQ